MDGNSGSGRKGKGPAAKEKERARELAIADLAELREKMNLELKNKEKASRKKLN